MKQRYLVKSFDDANGSQKLDVLRNIQSRIDRLVTEGYSLKSIQMLRDHTAAGIRYLLSFELHG